MNVFGVAVTRQSGGEKVILCKWLSGFTDSLRLRFRVYTMFMEDSRCAEIFGSSRSTLGMFLHGNRVGAEATAYGFLCAVTRTDWMAGKRTLPEDGQVMWDQEPSLEGFGKHREKHYNDVLREDPDYVVWAKSQETRLRII